MCVAGKPKQKPSPDVANSVIVHSPHTGIVSLRQLVWHTNTTDYFSDATDIHRIFETTSGSEYTHPLLKQFDRMLFLRMRPGSAKHKTFLTNQLFCNIQQTALFSLLLFWAAEAGCSTPNFSIVRREVISLLTEPLQSGRCGAELQTLTHRFYGLVVFVQRPFTLSHKLYIIQLNEEMQLCHCSKVLCYTPPRWCLPHSI